ncbi:ABC transporter permease subunit [Fodinicola feengrottensis]|uniref:ABC transporter permease subunit n=1 Tax=Fodinicola feengrottensis TaxID=435914 RepID=UPI0024413007|nr:ABC transporter permease subunit [Fodinicola feengrottensis]
MHALVNLFSPVTDHWPLYLQSFGVTVLLFLISGVASLLWGTALAGMRVSPVPVLRAFGTGYVNLLRNTPLTLVFFFVTFGFPYLDIHFSFFAFALIALTAYTSAFICEAVRAGLNSVPPGQAEAARAVGLTFFQTLNLVLLPQAFRAVVPPVSSLLIALLKKKHHDRGRVQRGRGRHHPGQPLRTRLCGLPGADLGGHRIPHPGPATFGAAALVRATLEGGMSTASVLFDAPGPKAQARYLTGGIVGSVVLVAVFAFVVYRFWVTGQFDGQKWSIFEYQQVQLTILSGYLNTLAAAAMAAVLAVTLGALLAAARLSDHRWLRGPAFAVVELFRAIPLLLLMFLAYYAAPGIGLTFSPFWSVVLGLTLYNGSVLAEIFRAGVEAVPKGQAEAAYAIGMRKTQVMTTVLLPPPGRTDHVAHDHQSAGRAAEGHRTRFPRDVRRIAEAAETAGDGT